MASYKVSPSDRDMLTIAQKMGIPYDQLRAANPNRTSVGMGEFINLPDVNATSGGIGPLAGRTDASGNLTSGAWDRALGLRPGGSVPPLRLLPNSYQAGAPAPQKSFLQDLWGTLTGAGRSEPSNVSAVRGGLLPTEAPSYNSNVHASPVRPGENQPPPQITATSGGLGYPSLNPTLPVGEQPDPFATAANPNPSFNMSQRPFNSGFGEGQQGGYQPAPGPSGSFAAPSDIQFQNNELARLSQGIDNYTRTLAYTGQAQQGYLPQSISLAAVQKLGVPPDFIDPTTGAPGTPAQFMQSLGYNFDANSNSWVQGKGAAQGPNGNFVANKQGALVQRASYGGKGNQWVFKNGVTYSVYRGPHERGGNQGYAVNPESTPSTTLAVRIGGG